MKAEGENIQRYVGWSVRDREVPEGAWTWRWRWRWLFDAVFFLLGLRVCEDAEMGLRLGDGAGAGTLSCYEEMDNM